MLPRGRRTPATSGKEPITKEEYLIKVEEGEGGGVGDVEEEEGEEEVDVLTTMSEEEASNVFQNFFDV